MKYLKYVNLYDNKTLWDSERSKVSAISKIVCFITLLAVFLITYIITPINVAGMGLLLLLTFIFLSAGKGAITVYTFYCSLFSYPFRYMKVKRLIKSGKCFDREDAGTIFHHYVYNGNDTNLFDHQWKCDTCERCGKTRITLEKNLIGGHATINNDSSVCKYCGVDIDEWNEYARSRCDGYDKTHDWHLCGCKRCGAERNHEWDGCICKRCGATRHYWYNVSDDPNFIYESKCSRCGVKKSGAYVGPDT